ncbi:MAG: 16S rRNA (guanine(966)-N(2))-methyltransferase RsmD [Clostridiales bacterium]|jgi:16S rRNA (guanine(966)-N(2))-methyltransferase RsmD|nr:16S rRNA (guanine(966)-N(2))-methyltransferase RsmD [Clostridiales bacterium]
MRIISGKHRGKKLFFPDTDKVRPTTDKAKEAVFGILHFLLKETAVLDLFAGSGALGLEALSRGAASAVFCDIDLKFVRKNLLLAGETADLYECDFLSALDRLSARGKTFDFIFLDPPYESDCGELAVKRIYEKGLLKKGGKIIFEHSRAKDLKDFGDYVTISDSRSYGTQGVSFIEFRDMF